MKLLTTIVTGTSLFAGTSALGAVLLTEDFEAGDGTPDVTGYDKDERPPNWVATGSGFGSDRHGLTDIDDGSFTGQEGVNEQAYALRYTSSPQITSIFGAIGSVVEGVTYTVEFQVQQDKNDIGVGGGNWYDVKLLVYNGAGEARSAGTLVDSSGIDTVPQDNTFHTVSFDWTADATYVGYDLGVRIQDVWAGGNTRTSGVVDNVVVSDDTVVPEPGSLALLSLGGLLIARRRRG